MSAEEKARALEDAYQQLQSATNLSTALLELMLTHCQARDNRNAGEPENLGAGLLSLARLVQDLQSDALESLAEIR